MAEPGCQSDCQIQGRTLTTALHCYSLGDTEYPLREGQENESLPPWLKGTGPTSYLSNPSGDPGKKKPKQVSELYKMPSLLLPVPSSPHRLSWRSVWLWEASKDPTVVKMQQTNKKREHI